MKPTFVVGDVHGHDDRLESLFSKAGIVNKLDHPDRDHEVIQLGDLGHFGIDTKEGDWWCYDLARRYVDLVLWGNHDRAVVDTYHRFHGYFPPCVDMVDIVRKTVSAFAAARHGYLLTHAGLSPDYLAWIDNPSTVENCADDLNALASEHLPLRGIGFRRGGSAPCGGILWRDHRESIADLPQIYGHTKGMLVREKKNSLCIDVGDQTNGNLCGIWLPEMKVVAVGPDADMIETQIWDGDDI